jgi:Endodeoxyribonuclease RusA
MYPKPSTSRDDHPNRWRIEVRGHPARVKNIRWREAIRDEVRSAYPRAPFPYPPLETKFDVEVTFRMTPKDLDKPALDLDNLVKPVLDTIFTSQNVSPEVTGVLFPVNDTWVFRLVLEKARVETPQDQGADITVTLHPPGTPDLSPASASTSV